MLRLKVCLSSGRIAAILFAAAAVLAADPAFASPIVYQHTAPAQVISTRASQDQTGGAIDFQVWDRFVLAGDTSIDGVDWQGSYFNTLQANPLVAPPANATGFVVQFYSDALGTPGALLASQTFTPTGANQTFAGTQIFNGLGLGVYDYSTLLSSPFLATGGLSYWLSVYALSPIASSTQAQWGWNGGTGGDGTSFQPQGGGVVNFDRALALHGTAAPVPEPATMLLFGSGLAAVAARARARRRIR